MFLFCKHPHLSQRKDCHNQVSIYLFNLQRYAYFPNPQNKIRRRWITFREDNSSLTLGRDHRYYFVFTLEEGQVKQLPDRLVRQALAIAQKVARNLLNQKGRKGLVEK
jgi:hypothetical protein